MRILIFGGTGEAVDLANALVRQDNEVTTSFAGVTRNPRLPNGHVHRGGFGGVEGLMDYINRNDFTLMIDATHAFAATMSRHIVDACEKLNKPMLRLTRPIWHARDGDNWQHVADLDEAAAQLPKGAHALVTIGRQHIEPFVWRDDCTIFLRAIEHPELIVPAHVTVMLERPPFSLEGEKKLMRENDINHLVTKNSGGGRTIAKLDAARELGIKVIMVDRPALPTAPEVYSVDGALKFVADHSVSAA